MPVVSLSIFGGVGAQFFDNNGNPLSGGKIYTYEAGTTTPLATYTSSSGDTAHTNPIVLDAGGRVPGGEIWNALQLYKLRLQRTTMLAAALTPPQLLQTLQAMVLLLHLRWQAHLRAKTQPTCTSMACTSKRTRTALLALFLLSQKHPQLLRQLK
jgi:hypothetical protein